MIPQCNPKAGYLAHKAEIDAAIGRVLNSGWYILGQEVGAFEQEFSDWIGLKNTVSVANGTDAIELALRALGVGCWRSSSNSITYGRGHSCGNRPYWLPSLGLSILNLTTLRCAQIHWLMFWRTAPE